MKIHYSTNPLAPGFQTTMFDVPDGSSPNSAIEILDWNFQQPTILLVNGEAWGRNQWNTALPESSNVIFVELPGGAGAVLAVISILLTAYSLYYFSTLDTDVPEYGTPDSLSSFSTGSNRLRLGQPFTEHFGRLQAYPDLVQQPYIQNIDNDQYLYFLGILGVGEYSVEEVYIANTPLEDYADCEYNIVEPGGALSLVPNLVWTCNAATGRELDVEYFPYVVTPPLTSVYSLEYDITFPGGLVRYNSKGKIKNQSVTVETEVRTVDNAGAPISEWTALETRTFTAASKDPKRYSNDIAVPLGAGRYQFRIRRTTAASESSRVIDRAVMTGLRGYGAEHPDYGDVTLVEAKLKAQDQLGSGAASQINVVATRKLYEVQSAGFGGVLTATQSVVDAVAYMVTAENGGQQSNSLLNFSELEAVRAALETADYSFNFRFGGRLSVMDAAAKAAACGLCAPCMPGGEFALILHENHETPSCMYTHDNIRDLKVTVAPRTPDNPTAIEMRYIDPDTWVQESIFCYDEDGSEDTPLDITLDGCANRQQAFEVGMFAYLHEKLERTTVSFVTDLSGYIPSLLSKILVPNKTTTWSASGLILSVDGTNIWLSDPVDFEDEDDGQLYITKEDGTVLGPYTVTPSGSNHCVVGSTALLNTLADDGMKASRWLFGLETDEPLMVRVTSIAPQERNSIQISGSMIDDDVYGAPGDAPEIEEGSGEAALLTGVSLEQLGEDSSGNYELRLTWSGSAVSVRIELDEGDSAGYVVLEDEYTSHVYEFETTENDISVRVTPYNESGIQAGEAVIRTITTISAPTGLTIEVDSDGNINIDWDDDSDADEYLVALYVDDVEVDNQTVTESFLEIELADIITLGGPWPEFDVYVWSLLDGEQSAPAMETEILDPLPAPAEVTFEDRLENGLMIGWSEVTSAVSYVLCHSTSLDSDGDFVPTDENVVYEGALPQAHIIELVMDGITQHGFKVAAQQYGHPIDELDFSDPLYGVVFNFGDHGQMDGLGDDDHAQYLLIDGTRAMTGTLDMGSNSIDNVTSLVVGSINNGGSAIAVSDNLDALTDSVEVWAAKLGIGTSVVPHGGVGTCLLAIEGANTSFPNGPHIQVTTDADDYPVVQYLNWGHDNIQWNFDAYFDGTDNISCDAGSNFQVIKVSDRFRIRYDTGVAQGSVISYNTAFEIDPAIGIEFGLPLNGDIADPLIVYGNRGRIDIRDDGDSYPQLSALAYTHDNSGYLFDAYYDGAFKSSDAGSNFALYKVSDTLVVRYDSGVAQGGAVSWNVAFAVDTSGNVDLQGNELQTVSAIDNGGSAIAVNDDLTVDGSISFVNVGDKIDFPNFLIEEWGTNRLMFKKTTSGSVGIFEFFTQDGDNTDRNWIMIYGLGNDTAGVTNSESLYMGFETTGTDRYMVKTFATGTGSAKPLELTTYGNTEQLYLNTDGNVGIGTATPGTMLEIGDASATPAITLNKSGSGTSSILFDNGGTPKAFVRNTAVEKLEIGTQAATDLDFYTSNTLRVTVDSTGYVAFHNNDLSQIANITMSGNLEMGGGELQTVSAIDNNGSAIDVNDNLDLSTNEMRARDNKCRYMKSYATGNTIMEFDASDYIQINASVVSMVFNSADLDLGGNNLDNVASIDNGGSAIAANDDLDMAGSDIKNCQILEINTSGWIQSDTYLKLLTSAGNNMIFDAGGEFKWRDVDAAGAERMILDSATGLLTMTGDIELAGNELQTVSALDNNGSAITFNDDITMADGKSINLQEDITFTGGTTVNQIKFPDDLATALAFVEGSTSYLEFCTTDGFEYVRSKSFVPLSDDTYYLGRNDDDLPLAWKGLILADQTDGKYYRIELNNGSIDVVDLTD